MKKGFLLLALLIAGFNIFAQNPSDLKPGIYMSWNDLRSNHPSYVITELPDIVTKLENNNDEYLCVEGIFHADTSGFVSSLPAKEIWGFCTGDEVYISIPDSIWNMLDFFQGATNGDPKAKNFQVDKTSCFYHAREFGSLVHIPKPIKRDFGQTPVNGAPVLRTSPQAFGKPKMPGKTAIEFVQAFLDMQTGSFYKLTYSNVAALIQARDPEMYAEWHKKKEAKDLYYFYLTQYNRKHPLEFKQQ
jgi:hypothetical protein